jgi:hypothetical protein
LFRNPIQDYGERVRRWHRFRSGDGFEDIAIDFLQARLNEAFAADASDTALAFVNSFRMGHIPQQCKERAA